MTRILVVEDETKLAAAIKRGLQREGFAVDVAADGTDGHWLAQENPYDAIVLDIMLPGIDGYEVCSRLRAASNWTPILVLTARDGVRDETRALDTGADDYLSKPFSFQVLLARLRAVLRRGSRERPSVLRAGGLELDPASKRCTRDSVQVDLTTREFAILEFFLRRPDEVLSKAEILEHVWDFAFEGDPNIVEVYIRRLRKKVDEPFGLHTIRTVRGAGYRIAADAASEA